MSAVATQKVTNFHPQPKDTRNQKFSLSILVSSIVCAVFFDSKSRKDHFLNAVTDRNYLTTVFKSHEVDLVEMEACGPSGWISDLAMSLGLKTLVCSTNEDAWKWINVIRKTEKDDALKLARMATSLQLDDRHDDQEDSFEISEGRVIGLKVYDHTNTFSIGASVDDETLTIQFRTFDC